MPPTVILGAAAAILIAAMAWRLRALNGSGAAGAAVLGTVAMTAGWAWGILLVAYFATSAALSRFRAGEKERRTGDRLEKGGPRDLVQVLANGGAFGVAAVAFVIDPAPGWQAAAAGALAASAADTWATEIGTLARREPRSILTLRPVPTGTSGGVSLPGLGASVAGAAFVMLVAVSCGWSLAAGAGAFAGGLAGSLTDSVLGATLQCRRWCDACRVETERNVHRCGARTRVIAGHRWLDNDGVNALCTVTGAVVALLVARVA